MQRGNLNYGLVQSLVTGTIATLVNMKNVPGEYFSSIETYFEDQLATTDIRPPNQQQVDTFKEVVYDKYIDTVVRHLKERFPDVHLLKAFNMFDGKSWPDENEEDFIEYGCDDAITLKTHFQDFLKSKRTPR